MENQEMTKEQAAQQLIQTQGQLEHQIMVNKELQRALGEYGGKNANLQVTVNYFQQYAEQLEQRIATEEQNKTADKKE